MKFQLLSCMYYWGKSKEQVFLWYFYEEKSISYGKSCFMKMLEITYHKLGKIESVFEYFTKFSVRKTASSQNLMWEKQPLYKIQCEKNTVHRI